MKKIVAVILAVVMAALCGCAKQEIVPQRGTVENGVYINEIPQGQFPYESVKNDSHMREIPYPEAEKITFFIYEEMNACRLACQRLGLGKEDVEKIFYSNSARIFGVK